MENEPKEQEGQKELSQEESAPEVDYDREKWEELKADKEMGTFRILEQGIEMGTPQPELELFLSEVVERGRKKNNFGIEFTLRTTLNKRSKSERWGSPEEIKALGEREYQEAVEVDDLHSQARIAEVLFGKNSPEDLSAVKRRNEAKLGETDIRISTDATLEEVIRAVNLRDLQGIELDFENKLRQNFDGNLVEAIVSNPGSDAKILDLFEAFGHSKEYIEEHLPIKFV